MKKIIYLLFATFFTGIPNSLTEHVPTAREVEVKSVVDGDTLTLNDDTTLRLLGVDCPEIYDDENVNVKNAYEQNIAVTQYKAYAQKSKDFVQGLVLGRKVQMNHDPIYKNVDHTDPLERVYAYIHVDGTFLNEELIKQGYCYTMDEPHQFQYRQSFKQLKEEAQRHKIGIWSESVGEPPKTL